MKTALLGLLLFCHSGLIQQAAAQASAVDETRIVIQNGGWQLMGDLRLPTSEAPVPAVLMLNQAAGDRAVYETLARHLADRGLASLRLDLRGHGESTNRGRFVPGERRRDPLIWESQGDVTAAHQFLAAHPRIDGTRIGLVGASYSGEEMAEAGRMRGYAQAYVVLSPGSFSDESIRGLDASGVPWLFVTSRDERYLQEIRAAVQAESETVEQVIVPGARHASDLLEAHPGLAERIAVWLAQRLRDEAEGFGHLLEEQATRYPLMEIQDVYKLIHQAALGSEHAVSDAAAAHRWMDREIATLADGPDDPLFDPLTPDSHLVRVHLRPYLAGGGDPDALVRAFIGTANTYPGSVDRLHRLWQVAERSAEAGTLPFSRAAMAAFWAERAEAGYPAVHHSAQYEAAYAPAYRVVARQHLAALSQR